MPISEIKMLQASVRSFQATIANSPRGDGELLVSTHLANHYNTLVEKAETFPQIKSHLPPQIPSTSNFAKMGMSDAQYTDLSVYLNQLLTLTDLLTEDE